MIQVPLWYISYSKSDAREFLSKSCGWKYYGGHHLENRLCTYSHKVYLPQKFNTDMRNNTLSASVRNGYTSREEAIEEFIRDRSKMNPIKRKT